MFVIFSRLLLALIVVTAFDKDTCRKSELIIEGNLIWDVDIPCLFDETPGLHADTPSEDFSDTEDALSSPASDYFEVCTFLDVKWYLLTATTVLQPIEAAEQGRDSEEEAPLADPNLGSIRILHLTFHDGCRRELDAVARHLGANLTTEIFTVHGNVSDMNVGPALSAAAWALHGARWRGYDAVVVSDTAPIARIFLDAGRWADRALIIWICNRRRPPPAAHPPAHSCARARHRHIRLHARRAASASQSPYTLVAERAAAVALSRRGERVPSGRERKSRRSRTGTNCNDNDKSSSSKKVRKFQSLCHACGVTLAAGGQRARAPAACPRR